MRIREATQKTVAIYPGRFHPFHKGHASVYNFLKSKFDTVYITTSNKIDPPKSPFSFEEKRAMMIHAGIPASAIVQTRQPYIPIEILKNFDPQNTSVVFAVSQKDMDEDPRFAFKPKKDGSPSYFQPAAGADMEGLDKHGYVMVAPTLNFTVLGEPMKSATEFRRDFAAADDEKQAAMITDLYGSYSKEIHNIMRNKIKEHADPYMEHVLAAESVLHDLNVLYEHRSFDMSYVAENAQKIIDRINTIPVVETLDYLDPNDAMDSIVAVPGVGTMSIRGLMSNIKDKMNELADKAASGQPSAFRDIKYRLDSNIIGVMVDALANAFDEIETIRRKGGKNSAGIPKNVFDSVMHFHEAWSAKYKRSINCNNPRGFSQRAHCAGRKKKTNEAVITEYVFQSIPLRVLDNLASRKDNRPFPIKTGPDSTFDVTPETARKFMSVYLRKEPEVQKAIDKTLNDPRKFIELFTDIMAGKTASGAKVADIAPDKMQEFKIVTPDAKDTMGIERIKMPQVAKDDYAEYLDYLKDAGASFTKETVPAKSLKAMQKEFSDAGILKQMQRDPSGKQKPLIASSDDYIIDGHHRWLVAVNTGQSLPIYRVNMPGAELLTLTLNFPKVSFKSIYESAGVGTIDKQNTTADVKPGETERQSKKLGLGGKPKLLHKSAAKNSTPNKLFNLGIAEIYTPLAIAIMEGGHELPDFAEVDEGAMDDIISINKKLQAQRDQRESGLKAQLYKLMRKALTLPGGSQAQVELIKDMNKIRKQLMMDPIAIPESVENAEQLEASANDWLVMMFDNNDIETILNAPDQFKQAPNTNSVYRAIFKDRNVQKENAKTSAKFIPYSTSMAGAQTYVQMSDNPGAYVIVKKDFKASDMLVNFQSIVEHYDLLIPQNWEDEVWMKRTPYYTKSNKNEIVFDSEGAESIQEEKDYMRGYCHVWALKDVKANPERELYARIGHHYDDDSEEVDHIFTVDKNTGKAYDVRGEFADADALLSDYDFNADEVEVVKITADDIQDWCDVGELKSINEEVSQVDIDQLERFADKIFAKVGIDVEFGRHFMDRVNDERNGKPITPAELTRLFKQEYKRYGKPIAQMGPEQQAVMKDLQTDINIPFMLQWDDENNELDLIAKTVMRKKDFKTSNREFAVERGGINVPFASGIIAQIVPHRALKVKKSTPGRLSYDQPETKRKRNN